MKDKFNERIWLKLSLGYLFKARNFEDFVLGILKYQPLKALEKAIESDNKDGIETALLYRDKIPGDMKLYYGAMLNDIELATSSCDDLWERGHDYSVVTAALQFCIKNNNVEMVKELFGTWYFHDVIWPNQNLVDIFYYEEDPSDISPEMAKLLSDRDLSCR